MITKEQIIKHAAGNTGAAMAMTLLMGSHPTVVQKIMDYGMEGSAIYVLWSDLCQNNPYMVARVVDTCPKELLLDACSREDYSGKGLLKPYLYGDHA